VSAHSGALEAVERVLNRGGEAEEVLRQVVAILNERLGRFVRIGHVQAGDEAATTAFPIAFHGNRVADLELGGELTEEDRALAERVATLVSPYAGGEKLTR
jgi:hypothetical protein